MREIFFFFILSLGTLPDLEKLVPSEKQGGWICCQEITAKKTHPKFPEGLQSPDSSQLCTEG